MSTLLKRLSGKLFILLPMTVAFAVSATVSLMERNWLFTVVTVALFLLSSYQLILLYRVHDKKILFMLDALENNDNAFHFPENEGTVQNRTINNALNRVTRILRNVKAETAQQEKYYELILNCVTTGIVVLNNKGDIYQKNKEALRLLGFTIFTHVRQLSKIDDELMEKVTACTAGDKWQTSFNNERSTVNISFRVSEITIRNEHFRVLALNDINSELDEREIDSWIRLIRVLTHEIMNAVTPISSISETLQLLSIAKDEELQRGLQTINATGKGLLSFVESYRKFTRIPTPEPSLFYVKEFIDRMIELTRHQQNCKNIYFSSNVHPSDLILYADENLISQVVINLMKNAIEAIGSQENGKITIRSWCNKAEEVHIEIRNNGTPILPEIAEHIFIPFFTTKQNGNGIGLSLSKQIMRLSGGSITLLPAQKTLLTIDEQLSEPTASAQSISSETNETVFLLKFK